MSRYGDQFDLKLPDANGGKLLGTGRDKQQQLRQRRIDRRHCRANGRPCRLGGLGPRL